jgi:hypothetical protein
MVNPVTIVTVSNTITSKVFYLKYNPSPDYLEYIIREYDFIQQLPTDNISNNTINDYYNNKDKIKLYILQWEHIFYK